MAENGSGANDGTTQDGGAGGGGAGGQGNSGASAADAGSAAASIDRSKLNPILRGMDEDQINEVFDTMFAASRARRENAGDEGDLSGVPRHARPVQTGPSEAERNAQLTALRDKYKKMMDPNDETYDPLTAMSEIAQLTVAPALGTINQRAIAGMMSTFRDNPNYPDFREHEEAISAVLAKRDATTLNESDVIGTYFMVVGAKQVEAKKKEAKKPPTTKAPSPEATKPPEKKAVEQLDELELSVARTMYRGKAKDDNEAAEMYLRDVQLEQAPMKVPVGGGKTA